MALSRLNRVSSRAACAMTLVLLSFSVPPDRMRLGTVAQALDLPHPQMSAGSVIVDGAYVQKELATLVTSYQHREAGQDVGASQSLNGHDEFAAAWLAELRSN